AIRPEIVIDSTNQNLMHLTFEVLEYGEGFTCQIIYEGQRSSLFGLTGSVDGNVELRAIWRPLPEYNAALGLTFILFLVLLFSRALIYENYNKFGHTLKILGWAILLLSIVMYSKMVITPLHNQIRLQVPVELLPD